MSSRPRPATLAPGGPSTPSRALHNRAEHLETAAIPSTRTPRSRVRRNSLVQSTLPQPGQIGDRRTGSGQHDEVGVGDICGPGRKPHCDIGLQPQRVNVGEVADPRQPHRADPKRVLHGARPPGDIEPSSESSQTSGLHGNTPSTGRPVSRAISRLAGPRATVTAELVHHEPGNQPLIGGRQERHRSIERGLEPTAVDIANHQHGHPRTPSQAHVHVVMCPEVDLRRAPRTLADNDVNPARKIRIRGESGLGERAPAASELRSGD